MPERWRRPASVIAIEPHETEAIWLPGGRVQRQARLVCLPETVERMRLGYMCCKCLEPFETPWPERCPVCGAPIRSEQAEYFAREFAGELKSKGFDYDEEREHMHEEIERG